MVGDTDDSTLGFFRGGESTEERGRENGKFAF